MHTHALCLSCNISPIGDYATLCLQLHRLTMY